MTTTAKVTQCRHFFHAVCLKKWLYMQDTCPLCHAVLYKDPLLKGRENSNNGTAENGGNNLEIPDPNHPEDHMDDISDLNTDDDSENENDLVDHDDPPYQAPPLIVLDQESSDGSDLEQSNSDSSASTGLSTSEDEEEVNDDFEFDDDDDDDDDEIIFHTAEHDGEEEEILNLMENQDSSDSEIELENNTDQNNSSSGCSSQGEVIDR